MCSELISQAINSAKEIKKNSFAQAYAQDTGYTQNSQAEEKIMSFYDDARQRVRDRKGSLRNSNEVINTDKRGYSREDNQRYKPGNKSNKK